MRWFFALNENSPGFWDYVNLTQVAVHTARQHTSLEPVCMYDGEENALTAWLRAVGVPIIRRTTFLGAITLQLSPILRGTYLRLEIPGICREQGWNDEFAFFSDCDVMFQSDAAEILRPLRPRFVAVAPESDRSDLVNFNAGVMLINVPAWEQELPAMTELFRTRTAAMGTPPDDQVLLQTHFAGRLDPLPLELNWKAYWPDTERASLLHFHGPKPAHKYMLLNRRAPASLQALASPHFYRAVSRWDSALLEALESVPLPDVPETRRIEPGFEGFDDVTGIGVPEGPFPAIMLPVVRWGVAPATEVIFTVPPGKRARFETSFQCPHLDQVVTISLGDQELTRIPIRRISDPHPVAIDLRAAPGQHRLRLSYARSYPQSNGDPRALAVLYRTLRITFGT